jgi:hypothetical protein
MRGGLNIAWGAVMVLLAVAAAPSAPAAADAPTVADQRVFELRTYTTHDGRLPALEARFREHTMRLFAKHGMDNIGYWIPVDRPNTLIYIIAHESRAAVTGNWEAFGSDPQWQEVARNSTRDGPILVDGGIQTLFMRPTDFSPLE